MLTFKVTVELIEPEKEVERMDISDAGLAKSKQESLDKVRICCENALWGLTLQKIMESSYRFGMLPYTPTCI